MTTTTMEIQNKPRMCGRPTKTRHRPCRNRLWGWNQVACETHRVEGDEAMGSLLRVAWDAGYAMGKEISAAGIRRRDETIKRLECRVAELTKPVAPDDGRYYAIGNDQVVEVDGYSYRWNGAVPLAIGDRVVLPANWVSELKHGSGPFLGTVNALGSTYRGGPLSFILRRAGGVRT